ncbi:hypothetical protein LCGC14_0829870 [marine sediment metagenome]|uniref:Glycosyltransferase 2-like domain-containing protein n=1 Tax=marine sediment metagenome TaxID=412755 RepID=A0A0F9Q1K5_9ZZZZ
MITIAHLIDNAGLGGAQTMLFELYYAINKYYPSYKQLIISHDNRKADKKFVASFGMSYLSKKSDKDILKKVQGKENPIIFYHKLASSTFSTIKTIKNNSKIPIIVINHTLFNSTSWKNVNYCNAMVAVSNHMKKKIKKWYPKIKRIECIHNGVNSEAYDKIKASRDYDNKILLTGRINRICGWKHSDDWIKWCLNMKLPKKMVHQYIGDGPFISRARSIAHKGSNRGNKVKMLGLISSFHTKVAILKGWDLFLYETRKDEGISMSILEALCCGVPVICSNHYGNKEIIKNGVNGYVFKNKAEGQKILNELCSNPKKLETLKKTTKKHFRENLDAKFAADKYIKLVNDIMEKGEVVIKIPEKKVVEMPKETIKENNEFTVLASAYNKEKYIRDWANSILKQKYRPLEVVVANDFSSDKTLDLLNSFSEEFKQKGIDYKIINNVERLYCGSSYRNAVEHTTGSYVGILDADDMLVDDSVEYVMKLYKNNPKVSWIYTQFQICDMNMKVKRRGFCSAPGRGESLLSLADRGAHGYGHWRTFNQQIKRPDKLFGKNMKCSVDKYMGYRLEEFGPGMFVDRICYNYRQYPVGFKESVSSTKHAMDVWREVVKKVHNRRKKYNYKPFPIIFCKK